MSASSVSRARPAIKYEFLNWLATDPLARDQIQSQLRIGQQAINQLIDRQVVLDDVSFRVEPGEVEEVLRETTNK